MGSLETNSQRCHRPRRRAIQYPLERVPKRLSRIRRGRGQERALDSMLGRISLRKTGVHFSGKCSNATMARFARRLGWTLAVLIGGLVAATLLTARWGDRALYPVPPGTPAVAIFLVSHGWHSGIALPREVMADVAGRRGN